MPFTGQWVSNVLESQPYTNDPSYPGVNPANNFGDWATNVYAPEGTPIILNVTSGDGPVTFRWVSSTASCDHNSSKIEVFVSGVDVGWIFFAHFQGGRGSNTSDPQPTNGMTIGTMHYFPPPLDCNPGPHLHVELSDNHSGALKYSCWTDNGQPGVTLQQGDSLGILGSLNQATKQACTDANGGTGSGGGTTSSTTTSPSSTTTTTTTTTTKQRQRPQRRHQRRQRQRRRPRRQPRRPRRQPRRPRRQPRQRRHQRQPRPPVAARAGDPAAASKRSPAPGRRRSTAPRGSASDRPGQPGTRPGGRTAVPAARAVRRAAAATAARAATAGAGPTRLPAVPAVPAVPEPVRPSGTATASGSPPTAHRMRLRRPATEPARTVEVAARVDRRKATRPAVPVAPVGARSSLGAATAGTGQPAETPAAPTTLRAAPAGTEATAAKQPRLPAERAAKAETVAPRPVRPEGAAAEAETAAPRRPELRARPEATGRRRPGRTAPTARTGLRRTTTSERRSGARHGRRRTPPIRGPKNPRTSDYWDHESRSRLRSRATAGQQNAAHQMS